MSKDAKSPTYTVTTESGHGKASVRFARVFCSAYAIGACAMGASFFWFPDEQFDPSWLRYFCIAGSIVAGVFLFAFPKLLRRGTWRVTEHGIEFLSRDGKCQFLVWNDVEAVSLCGPSFRGSETTITLPLQYMKKREDRKALLNFIESQLDDEFDLRPRPQPKLTFAKKCIRWMKLVLIAIACTTFGMGGFLLHLLFLDDLLDKWGMSVLSGALAPVIMLLPLGILLALAYRTERRYPTWRDRGELYESLSN